MKFVGSDDFDCEFLRFEFVLRPVHRPIVPFPHLLNQCVVVNYLHYYNFILLLTNLFHNINNKYLIRSSLRNCSQNKNLATAPPPPNTSPTPTYSRTTNSRTSTRSTFCPPRHPPSSPSPCLSSSRTSNTFLWNPWQVSLTDRSPIPQRSAKISSEK